MTLTELKTLHSQGKAISGQSYSAKDKDGKILYFVGTADRRLKEITSSPSKPSVNTTVTNITNNTSSTGVQTVTDDGNGVVVVDNTDPTNPIITYVNPGYLTVETDPIYSAWIAGPPNISEFFNDVGYITSATGTTNLGYTASPTDGTVTSDTGTDATLPLADTTNAGLLSPGDKLKLNNTSGTNTGDQNLAPYLLISTAASTYQPLDSDLTAIAALSTTSYGRAFLELANQAALVALLPSYQPLDSDLTAIAALTTDSFGRDLLTKTSAANVRSYIGAGTGNGDALTTNPLSQFAATTSAQLAGVLSDETGTGAAVFANTPTLVTPILGTPTSGNLANCTFPTANIRAFSLNFSQISQASITDSTTYYLGNFFSDVWTTTQGIRGIQIPLACTLTDVFFQIFVSAGGTETLTFSVNLLSTVGAVVSNTALFGGTVTLSTGNNIFSTTGLSLAITKGQMLEIKCVVGAVGTNPTAIRVVGSYGFI